jgi:hypothetical protein
VDVAVNHCPGFVERDGGYGSGSIRTYALQRHKFPVGGRKFSPVLPDYLIGRGMHIPGPGIISQALPYFEHFLQIRSGKAMNVRERGHKPEVICRALNYPGLLKDDLRNPDRIGILCFPPGEIPLVGKIPIDQNIAYMVT